MSTHAQGKDKFEAAVNDIMYRVRKSEDLLAVFTVHDKIMCTKQGTLRFNQLLNSPSAVFIGVYNCMVKRDDLSADISIIVDEIPDPDELCIKRIKNSSIKK